MAPSMRVVPKQCAAAVTPFSAYSLSMLSLWLMLSVANPAVPLWVYIVVQADGAASAAVSLMSICNHCFYPFLLFCHFLPDGCQCLSCLCLCPLITPLYGCLGFRLYCLVRRVCFCA